MVKAAEDAVLWAEAMLVTAEGPYGNKSTILHFEEQLEARQHEAHLARMWLRICLSRDRQVPPKPDRKLKVWEPSGGARTAPATDGDEDQSNPYHPPDGDPPAGEGRYWTYDFVRGWVPTDGPFVTVMRCLSGTWHVVTYMIVVTRGAPGAWSYGDELQDLDTGLPCISAGRDPYPAKIIHQVAAPPPAGGDKTLKTESPHAGAARNARADTALGTTTTTTTTYDADGNEQGRTITTDDGKGNTTTTDAQGNILGKTTTTDDGQGTTTAVTTDGQGNVTSRTTSTDDGKSKTSTTTINYDSQGHETGRTVTTSDGKTTTTTTTDGQGHMTGQSETTSDGQGTTTTIFKDGQGHVIGQTTTKEDGTGATTTYYDGEGKPTGRVTMARHECVKGSWHRVTYDISDPEHWVKLQDVDDGQPCPPSAASASGAADPAKATALPVIAGAAVVVVVVGAIAAFALLGHQNPAAPNVQTSSSPSVSASASSTPAPAPGSVSLDPQPNLAAGSFTNGRGACGSAPTSFTDAFRLTIVTGSDGVPNLRIDQPSTVDSSAGPFAADRKSIQVRSDTEGYLLQVVDATHLQGIYAQTRPGFNCMWNASFSLQGSGLVIR